MTLIQCLVFLECERGSTIAAGNHISGSSGSSATQKYVLFPSGLKSHPVCKPLRQAGFQVLVNPSANPRFLFLEMLVDEKPVSERISLYVDYHYSPLFNRLLSEWCCIKSVSSCNSSGSLLSAVDEQNLALIEKFLVNGADIRWCSHPGQEGRTYCEHIVKHILHFAVKTGPTALINLLLTRGANVNARMDDCSTALHIAVQENKLQIAKLLLNNNADVNVVKNASITPMHIAVGKGFVEMVKLLVENDADLCVKNADGLTPLHLAVKRKRRGVQIVKQLLLGAKTDLERMTIINARTNDFSTPLYNAVLDNKLQIACLLLKHNADANTVLSRGITPLHTAVEKGFFKIVKLLVENGADLRARNAYGLTPLHLAVEKGHAEIVERLFYGPKTVQECGMIINSRMNDCSTPLHIAVRKNELRIASLLLNNKADVNVVKEGGITPMHEAVKKGSAEMVKLLVENGADLCVKNADGLTPLHLAVKEKINCVEIVKQLLLGAKTDLERMAIINARTNDCSTPLYNAVLDNKLQIACLLLKHNADANTVISSGITPLHTAVEKGFFKMVKLLVKNGADLRARNAVGLTPLHLAVKEKHLKIVEQLLFGAKTDPERKAILNARRNDCSTPLHDAVRENELQIASLLLKNNADVNAVTSNDLNLLYIAAENGFLEMVKLLVENGADLRVRIRGQTPLDVAVSEGHIQIVEHLLHHGINPDVKATLAPQLLGKTSLHQAVLRERTEIVALLLEKGADVNAELHDGRSALYLTLTEGLRVSIRLEICQLFSRYGLDVNNASNRKAFYHALTRGTEYRQVSVCLLECGFDVNVDDANNPRLLFGIVRQNLHETVKKLFSFGVSVQAFEFEGGKLTLLHVAAQYADGDMIEVLLSNGANINAVTDNSSKRTPLSEAIEYSNVKTIKALLANNANVNDPPGLLHLAFKKCPEVVQLLLEYGANVNARNADGQTLLSVATFTDKLEVVDALMKFGAHCRFRDTEPMIVSSADNFQAFLDHGFTDFDSESEIHFQKFLNHPHNLTKFRDCAEKLAYQIVKMEVAYEIVNAPVLSAELDEKLKLSDFKKKCEREIANMKLEIFPDTEISLYSILTKKTQRISCFARNERIMQSLEALKIKENYPIYASVVECQIRKGSLRRQIVKVGVKLLNVLFSQFPELPLELKEKTVNYLNNQDVFVLKKCMNCTTDL